MNVYDSCNNTNVNPTNLLRRLGVINLHIYMHKIDKYSRDYIERLRSVIIKNITDYNYNPNNDFNHKDYTTDIISVSWIVKEIENELKL